MSHEKIGDHGDVGSKASKCITTSLRCLLTGNEDAVALEKLESMLFVLIVQPLLESSNICTEIEHRLMRDLEHSCPRIGG